VTDTARYVLHHVFPAAASLLPPEMDRPPAWRLLAAIGMQESAFTYRRQIAAERGGERLYGPARGWFQFEMGGVEGVLEHKASREHAANVLDTLGYPLANARDVHLAIEHNDVLAACWARLLLWTDPRALPTVEKPNDGWLIYLATWRPGKARPEKWQANYAAAWAMGGPGTVRA
jgi:hypothetical protein